MKKAVLFLCMVLAGLTARAGDLTAGNAFFTYNYTAIVPYALQTNTVYSTNYCEDSLYHTWYLSSTTNLNGLTCAIAFSGDTTNWVTWGTIGVATTGNPVVNVSTNAVFKQSYFRYTFTGTNYNATIKYLGGR